MIDCNLNFLELLLVALIVETKLIMLFIAFYLFQGMSLGVLLHIFNQKLHFTACTMWYNKKVKKSRKTK